jgi:hypothetical protein
MLTANNLKKTSHFLDGHIYFNTDNNCSKRTPHLDTPNNALELLEGQNRMKLTAHSEYCLYIQTWLLSTE